MKQDWDGAELCRWWSLNFDELALIESKHHGPGSVSLPPVAMSEQVFLWCRNRGIQGPADGEVKRLVRSARREFEDAFLERIAAALNADTIAKMEASLTEPESVTGFSSMKADPSRLDLKAFSLWQVGLPS